jgi:SAM-dependent methyltransferase
MAGADDFKSEERGGARQIHDVGFFQIFTNAIQIRRMGIIHMLLQAHDGMVVSGPFAGMKLLPEVVWGDGNLPALLLGCYEAELHPAIAKAVARNPTLVVNVGCGEGYYAIGLARLLPQARVFAFDSNQKSQDICRRAAVANRVGNQLIVGGRCDTQSLRDVLGHRLLAQTERPLLIVDCEGAEFELLDPARVPETLHCDMIIECHDFAKPGTTEVLKKRFSASHDIADVVEGPRDPCQFVTMRGWHSIDRWLAINEGRPVPMNWLACWAR